MLTDVKAYFLRQFNALHDIRAEPEAVAGGVAIGMFMGFTPFIGFKTLLALFIAWIARCSKIAAVITVTLHDVTLFAAPVLLWVEYHIGIWVLQRPAHLAPPRQHGHFWQNLASLWNWEFFNHYIYPVFIGSVVIGLPIAIASYILMHGLLVKVRRRRLAAEETARAIGAAIDPNDI